MHYVGYAGLAAAVANAGGLGLVTALTQPTPEALRAEIKKAQDSLRPGCEGAVGVNLTILPMFSEVDYGAYRDVIIDRYESLQVMLRFISFANGVCKADLH